MKRALKLSLAAIAAAAIVAPAHASVIDKVSVKAAATYTEASGNGLHFADVLTAGVAANGTWRPIYVQPDHTFDYALGMTFRLAGHDTRFFIDYDHFKDDESRHVAGDGVAALGIAAIAGTNADITSNVEHKERDFKFGLVHTMHFGSKLDMDVAGAVEYAKVQRTVNNQHRRINTVTSQEIFNEFEGFGPNLSATGRVYPWGNENRDWSFWARAGVALLYGDHTHNHSRLQTAGGAPAPFGNQSFDAEDTTGIVTRVEADAGVEWTRVMRADFSDLQLGVKLGIKYHNMNNAFKNGDLTQLPANVGLGNDLNTSPDDYGRMGPFLEFRIGGGNA